MESANNSWITADAFHRIGYRHHHGIDIILSSLWTENSSGIGEFYDLIPLIDFCKSVGFDIIQLLPINDTGTETSPYTALTSCGLNPIFLSLWKLPGVDKQELKSFKHFLTFPKVPYQEVLEKKIAFLKHYYERNALSFDYHEFVEKNRWLENYSIFKAEKEITPISTDFFSFLQYLCFVQMREVKSYANAQGIFLKGDIPILISRDSADVSYNSKDFDFRFTAGAPPDKYSSEGQNWGFPLYNWEAIEADGFFWWKQRLEYAENFFDIFRLDHIIGFFRIWAIPQDAEAREGFFIPKEYDLQEAQGLSILTQLLPRTKMLPIGEDLGFNTGVAQINMEKLGIPGTKVIRWMRNYNTDGSFIPYDLYPELSLCTLSTHDSETLTLWWKSSPHEVEAFCSFRNVPYASTLSKTTRLALLKEAHHTSSLFHINLLGEYLALFDELVWENPEDERINIPGLILPTNWTYRLRTSVEEITKHKELKNAIRSILSAL